MRKQGVIAATVEAQVAFHDVDVAGVVWHGHYLKYLENARWALMQRLDFGLDAMLASGYAWPIVEVHVKYVRAARFGDRLAVQASLVEWQSRLAVNYLVTHAATAERVARARTVQVAVEASTGALQFATPAVLVERVDRCRSGFGPTERED
ncbi:MAG TPA: acyl-CoA thioesterase [Steroidobacteraceae bacterium]|nr:acyl-CoA thioesterase [Steroidobacteraceae bacterium]